MIYIWKEWKEQSRGIGLWLALSMVIVISIFLLWQARDLPAEQGFAIFLLSLHNLNVYIIPLLCLFIASFSIFQEKEQRTLMMLITKQETYRSFLWKKSLSIQLIITLLFASWYFLLAVPMKFLVTFEIGEFMQFLFVLMAQLVIFNQIGIMLGSICRTKMQLIGGTIFTWFVCLFFIDLLLLYYLPYVTENNIRFFSTLFFLHPLHTLHFYLETSLGLFPLDHMSRLMQKMMYISPIQFLGVNLVIWLTMMFEIAVWLRGKGEEK